MCSSRAAAIFCAATARMPAELSANVIGPSESRRQNDSRPVPAPYSSAVIERSSATARRIPAATASARRTFASSSQVAARASKSPSMVPIRLNRAAAPPRARARPRSQGATRGSGSRRSGNRSAGAARSRRAARSRHRCRGRGFGASATLVRTKNACSLLVPASAEPCLSRARKSHTCRSSAAARSGVRAARNTQRVCCSTERRMNAVRRATARSWASASTAVPAAKLTLPWRAAMPGCRRTKVFTPRRCRPAACFSPTSTIGARLPFSVVSTGGMPMPHAAPVAAREHAGDDTAGRHAGAVPSGVATQPHAREIRDRVAADLPRVAQAEHGRVDGGPRPRRIPNQQGATALAVTRRRQKARAPEVAARRRRDAEQVDRGTAIEREQSRALAVRADDVVVRELLAVRARARQADVRNRLTRERRPRRLGSVARQRPDEAHELRIVQRVDDEPLVGRDPSTDLRTAPGRRRARSPADSAVARRD